jgi:hypothetical protein
VRRCAPPTAGSRKEARPASYSITSSAVVSNDAGISRAHGFSGTGWLARYGPVQVIRLKKVAGKDLPLALCVAKNSVDDRARDRYFRLIPTN